ncbi:hypothetical protein TEA_005741 [Camellia sinensis var. sinensis]|uniref:P-type ATPase A domain-containing protein n=1 Tax=Camellia sinensis var. sinensis TaxID=542762 RepID=A0A4S4EN69_CAMSN|nr:hypothetical protein TEA_005741 [Camellia sinensis var. sinensis]
MLKHCGFLENDLIKPSISSQLKEGWYDGGSIFVAVFLVIAVSPGSNFKQNRQFLNLSKVSNNIPIDIVRNGRRKQVLIFKIVVGDVVCLKIGDQVPAYGLFIDGHSLLVEQTPLQGRLNKLTSAIGKIVRYFISVVGIVLAAVTIVGVAIPEGLSLAVTLTLAYSMKRMIADQAMVRKLFAYETMGSVTDICTVKMGTLTLNQMQRTKFWLGRESMQEKSSTSISDNILELLYQGVCFNTTGSVYKSTSGS